MSGEDDYWHVAGETPPPTDSWFMVHNGDSIHIVHPRLVLIDGKPVEWPDDTLWHELDGLTDPVDGDSGD